MYMGSKNITVTEDVYERVKAHKRPDESFSDTLRRLTRGDRDPLDTAGNWPGVAEAAEASRRRLGRDLGDRGRKGE
ncbi:antitoxin VapB family protein [Halalkalicoccus tibetensis]|uniref:Antitoxin VapB family protein n=1 Tax=Halalkalicoccus tibetensis TaxID=175632 RepID=A0ABD5UZ58_9EURY